MYMKVQTWKEYKLLLSKIPGFWKEVYQGRYNLQLKNCSNIFAKPKDVTKEQRTDAIYFTPCNDCDNEHIGQTKRQFGTRLKEHQKAVFFCKKENSALSEHTCLTNHTIGWDNSKIITTNRRYHQRLCLEAWHINSAHAPLNRDDGGLLPDAYLHLVRKKAAN